MRRKVAQQLVQFLEGFFKAVLENQQVGLRIERQRFGGSV
jgi:hypothetical protein